MTTPLPADMLMFFMIRMDTDMIESILNEQEIYAGMSCDDFVKYLDKNFEHHRSIGDSTVLALQGTINNGTQVAYSFKGNKSLTHFELVLIADEQKMIIDIVKDTPFVFDKNNFVIND